MQTDALCPVGIVEGQGLGGRIVACLAVSEDVRIVLAVNVSRADPEVIIGAGKGLDGHALGVVGQVGKHDAAGGVRKGCVDRRGDALFVEDEAIAEEGEVVALHRDLGNAAVDGEDRGGIARLFRTIGARTHHGGVAVRLAGADRPQCAALDGDVVVACDSMVRAEEGEVAFEGDGVACRHLQTVLGQRRGHVIGALDGDAVGLDQDSGAVRVVVIDAVDFRVVKGQRLGAGVVLGAAAVAQNVILVAVGDGVRTDRYVIVACRGKVCVCACFDKVKVLDPRQIGQFGSLRLRIVDRERNRLKGQRLDPIGRRCSRAEAQPRKEAAHYQQRE